MHVKAQCHEATVQEGKRSTGPGEKAGVNEEFILAAVQGMRRGGRNMQKRLGGQRAQPRAATPPRDARDVKCANCGQTGHAAKDCKKERIPFEQRKCHICNKAGHIRR